jgi:hypothetical protein
MFSVYHIGELYRTSFNNECVERVDEEKKMNYTDLWAKPQC